MTFTSNADSGVTITEPTNSTSRSALLITGPVDGVNAVLATMQASISSEREQSGPFYCKRDRL